MASLYCSTSYFWTEWSKFLYVRLEVTGKYPNFKIFLMVVMYCCKQACSDACFIDRGWCTQLAIHACIGEVVKCGIRNNGIAE